MINQKILYHSHYYTIETLEKHLEKNIYSLIIGKETSVLDCNVHLLFLTAIKFLKKLDINYTKELQEIMTAYQQAELSWFFNRNSKVTSAIELARFHIISLCEKDLIYVPKYNFYHQHHYHKHR